MKYGMIPLLVAVPMSLFSQTLKFDRGTTVERMCGRVTDSEFTSTPWSTSEMLGPGLPKKADVRLYRREGKGKCCAPNALVSVISTGNDGGFAFKDSVPGEYWLLVVVGKRKYKLAVSLVPGGEKASHECSDIVFQIHGDDLRLLRMYKMYQLTENVRAH